MSNTNPIDPVNINNELSSALRDTGIVFHDYKLNKVQMDYQDLTVMVSKTRASAIEKEIPPLETKMRRRNNNLKSLGDALSYFTGLQKNFNGDSGGGATTDIKEKDDCYRQTYYNYFGTNPPGYDSNTRKITNSGLAETVQRLKSEIDSLNNESQLDMNRLQELVTKRDEAYTNASDLLKTISGTRDTAIGSIN